MKKLRVVWGAPCSGKSTYCKKHMTNKDTVFDFDEVRRAITYGELHDKDNRVSEIVMKMRWAWIRACKEDQNIDYGYMIVSRLTEGFRKLVEDIAGDPEYILVESTLEECLKNLENDDTRPNKDEQAQIIKDWFNEFGKEKEKKMKRTFLEKMKDRQVRALNLLTGADERLIQSDYYVEGYAATFDPYILYEDNNGPIYEQFDRHCFDNADMSDVIFLLNHEGRVLARQSNGSLVLRIDDKGLLTGTDLSLSDHAKEIYGDIKSGLITKMSWSFKPGEFEYNKDTRTIYHKSIKKVYDVSAVSIPANDGTDISARSFCDGVIAEVEAERLKRARVETLIKLTLNKR